MIPFLKEISNKFLLSITTGKAFYGIVLILCTFSSFFLGRLSSIFEQRPVFEMTSIPNSSSALDENFLEKYSNTSTSTIVASKKGKRYYFVWCKYASTIKESNKIYFDTEEQAQKRGLTLAANCKQN